jgi:hypothetical protein
MDRRPVLARVLWLGALWDLGSFVLLMAMPAWLLELFHHPVPAEPFLFRLAGLPLLMAPVVYVMAARDARPASPLVSASIGLRAVGALGIVGMLLSDPPQGAAAYWTFAGADLVLAAAIALARR